MEHDNPYIVRISAIDDVGIVVPRFFLVMADKLGAATQLAHDADDRLREAELAMGVPVTCERVSEADVIFAGIPTPIPITKRIPQEIHDYIRERARLRRTGRKSWRKDDI